MKHEAAEKQQDQAEYGTKEININTFPVLMKNSGWRFSFMCAQPLLRYKVRGFLLSFLFWKNY